MRLRDRLKAALDRFLNRLGYVSAAALVRQAHEHAEALRQRHDAQAKVEQELRHSKRNLEHQLAYRALLEKDVEFLRTLELARVSSYGGVQQATETMDRCTTRLVELMQAHYPDAIINDPTEGRVTVGDS